LKRCIFSSTNSVFSHFSELNILAEIEDFYSGFWGHLVYSWPKERIRVDVSKEEHPVFPQVSRTVGVSTGVAFSGQKSPCSPLP
jgi:ribosomal protein L31